MLWTQGRISFLTGLVKLSRHRINQSIRCESRSRLCLSCCFLSLSLFSLSSQPHFFTDCQSKKTKVYRSTRRIRLQQQQQQNDNYGSREWNKQQCSVRLFVRIFVCTLNALYCVVLYCIANLFVAFHTAPSSTIIILLFPISLQLLQIMVDCVDVQQYWSHAAQQGGLCQGGFSLSLLFERGAHDVQCHWIAARVLVA